MYIIEFRNGGYFNSTTNTTGKSVAFEDATVFFTEAGADKEARQWSLAGAMVVPYVERSNDES